MTNINRVNPPKTMADRAALPSGSVWTDFNSNGYALVGVKVGPNVIKIGVQPNRMFVANDNGWNPADVETAKRTAAAHLAA